MSRPPSEVTGEVSSRVARASRSAEHWILLAGSALAFALLVAFALWVEPDPRGFGTHEKLGLPPCAPMELWNVPCPGCGVTTAVALASHGHVVASFTTQPFGCVLALLVPVAFAWALACHARGRDLRDELVRLSRPAWVLSFVGLAAGAWIYKLARVRGWIG